jgi:hypothetical protein
MAGMGRNSYKKAAGGFFSYCKLSNLQYNKMVFGRSGDRLAISHAAIMLRSPAF